MKIPSNIPANFFNEDEWNKFRQESLPNTVGHYVCIQLNQKHYDKNGVAHRTGEKHHIHIVTSDKKIIKYFSMTLESLEQVISKMIETFVLAGIFLIDAPKKFHELVSKESFRDLNVFCNIIDDTFYVADN